MSDPVAPEVLFEIEQAIAEPTFLGVPIGSTLGPQLIYWHLGTMDCSWRAAWLARLRYPYHRAFPPPVRCRRLAHANRPQQNRLLFTWISTRSDSTDMVLPVIEACGPGCCHVLCALPEMENLLPRGAGFTLWGPQLAFDVGRWRREFAVCAPEWRKRLLQVLRKHRVPGEMFPILMHILLIRSFWVTSLEDLLVELKPSGVVTEYDRFDWTACLVLAAKARGIPTWTMMHGVVNPPYGYTPLLADTAFCWGQLQHDQMVALGTAPHRLRVTGFQRMTRELAAETASARIKIGLDPAKPVILLATAPVSGSNRRLLVRTFCEALGSLVHVSAVVRVHPSEKSAFYDAEAKAFPRVRFLENAVWAKDEALAAAEIVVVHDSGFGDDALVKRRLVVVLDALPTPPKHGRVLVEQAGAPTPRNSDELRKVVEELLCNRAAARQHAERAEKYIRYAYAAFGSEAVANIRRELLTTLQQAEVRCEPVPHRAVSPSPLATC